MKMQLIEFTCHAPEAQTVFVAGTFNDWYPVRSRYIGRPTGIGEPRCHFRPDITSSSSSSMASGAENPAATTNIAVARSAARIRSAP